MPLRSKHQIIRYTEATVGKPEESHAIQKFSNKASLSTEDFGRSLAVAGSRLVEAYASVRIFASFSEKARKETYG